MVLDEAVLDNREDGEKLIWLFDIREPTNPVSIATFPPPDEADYVAKGAHFGPHNLHENRPGSFVSSTLILPRIRMPACGLTIFPTRIARWRPGRWSRLRLRE